MTVTREQINKVDRELYKAIEAYDYEDDPKKKKILKDKSKVLQKKYNDLMDKYYTQ